MTTARQIVELVKRYRFDTSSEAHLQAGLHSLFSQAGLDYEREVALGNKEPGSGSLLGGPYDDPLELVSARQARQKRFSEVIDFVIGTIGVEVKVRGSRAGVIRQLHRYLQYPELSEIIVVSTRLKLERLPDTLAGKPVHVVTLLHGVM